MHVVLTPVGSAGDVNPFVIIGRELRRRGHRVTLVAPVVFAGSASNAGLEFKPLGTADEFERVTRDPDLWHPRRGLGVVFAQIAGGMRRAYTALEEVYEPDQTFFLAGSLAFATRVFEEVHQVPVATIHLAPSIFRSDFKQPAMPSGADISAWPRWIKRLLWWGLDRVAIDPLILPALNGWRAELGLSPISRVFKSWINSPQRVLGLFPEWFGEPQLDWPRQARLTGFVLSDESCAPYSRHPDGGAAPAARPGNGPSSANAGPGNGLELERFLANGQPPVVFTPGSANRQASPFFRAAIEATRLLGQRALLVTTFREHLPAELPEHAAHVPFAAFASLFPRAAAVVHHGGIGTCAQGLAAGVPQLVMPIGFDQPDNAARLTRLGVGEAIDPGRFTGEPVAAALSRLLSSASVADACRQYREKIDPSLSVRLAADLITEQVEAFQPRLKEPVS